MSYKISSLFTLFFFLIFLITIIASTGPLIKVNVVAPTEGQHVSNGKELLVAYNTTDTEKSELGSIHVLLLNENKQQVYSIISDQRVDGASHDATVPWYRLKPYKTCYIRKYNLMIL